MPNSRRTASPLLASFDRLESGRPRRQFFQEFISASVALWLFAVRQDWAEQIVEPQTGNHTLSSNSLGRTCLLHVA